MSGVVIVGCDSGPASADTLALGLLLHDLTDGRLILACVEEDGRGPPAVLQGACRPALEAAATQTGDREAETRILRGDSAARALHQLAEEEEADFLVLGSTHRGAVGRIAPGSVARRLLNGGGCTIAVAPRGYADAVAGEPRVLAVAFDGSPEAAGALAVARALGESAQATLRVIAVHPPVTVGSAETKRRMGAAVAKERLHEALREATSALPPRLRAEPRLLPGLDPATVLLSEAELGVDLLVLGSRGYGPLATVLLGSVSTIVMESSPCPALVVPRGAHAPTRRSTP